LWLMSLEGRVSGMTQHPKCNGCIHLDGLEWECRLGNKILAIKVFKPVGPCEKDVVVSEVPKGGDHHGL